MDYIKTYESFFTKASDFLKNKGNRIVFDYKKTYKELCYNYEWSNISVANWPLHTNMIRIIINNQLVFDITNIDNYKIALIIANPQSYNIDFDRNYSLIYDTEHPIIGVGNTGKLKHELSNFLTQKRKFKYLSSLKGFSTFSNYYVKEFEINEELKSKLIEEIDSIEEKIFNMIWNILKIVKNILLKNLKKI